MAILRHDGAGVKCGRGSHDRTHVMWIGHLVEDDNRTIRVFVQHIVEKQVGQRIAVQNQSLMRRVARHEGLQQVLEWSATLEEEERQLFVHCGLEGLSYPEVSALTGVHKDTIAKRWQGLRGRLAQFALPRDLVAGED